MNDHPPGGETETSGPGGTDLKLDPMEFEQPQQEEEIEDSSNCAENDEREPTATIKRLEEENSRLRQRLANSEQRNLRLATDLEAALQGNRVLVDEKAKLESDKADLENNAKRLEENKAKLENEVRETKILLQETRDSMAMEMLLALFQGLTGWSPFLPFQWNNNNNSSSSGRDTLGGGPGGNPPLDNNINNNSFNHRWSNSMRQSSVVLTVALGWGDRLWTRIRKPYFVFASVVDLVDSFFDIYVSSNDIMNGDCEDSLQRWALWLLVVTILARMLSGVYGVVYTAIDTSDREPTYFLVEMTVWMVEDMASAFYIILKRHKLGIVSWVDDFNMILTAACAILFVIPTLCRYKTITKQLSPFASRVLVIYYGSLFVFLIAIVLFAGKQMEQTAAFQENIESIVRASYSGMLALQLFLLYSWSRYLYRKKKLQSQSRQQDLLDTARPSERREWENATEHGEEEEPESMIGFENNHGSDDDGHLEIIHPSMDE